MFLSLFEKIKKEKFEWKKKMGIFQYSRIYRMPQWFFIQFEGRFCGLGIMEWLWAWGIAENFTKKPLFEAPYTEKKNQQPPDSKMFGFWISSSCFVIWHLKFSNWSTDAYWLQKYLTSLILTRLLFFNQFFMKRKPLNKVHFQSRK